MGFAGSLFSGNNGAGWTAASAPLINVATQQQGQQSYDQTQQALQQQQAFLQALQAQNGIQNQSSVFNQLQGVANGTGPNPAQAQLNNATGQNVANQAALMASQRGAGANAGLLARQAGQQGANTQQQAVGQGAALQAQQSMNALNQLGGIAGQQVNQQQQAVGNLNQFAQGNQQNVYNALGQQNNANVSNTASQNAANASIQNTIAGQQGQVLGGIAGGVGSLLSGGSLGSAVTAGVKGAVSKAHGGMIESNGPKSAIARSLANGGKVPVVLSPGEKVISPEEAKKIASGDKKSAGGKIVPGQAKVKGDSKVNDTVNDSLEPGSIVIPRSVMDSKDPKKHIAAFVKAHMDLKNNR